jgi:hypothetical protein
MGKVNGNHYQTNQGDPTMKTPTNDECHELIRYFIENGVLDIPYFARNHRNAIYDCLDGDFFLIRQQIANLKFLILKMVTHKKHRLGLKAWRDGSQEHLKRCLELLEYFVDHSTLYYRNPKHAIKAKPNRNPQREFVQFGIQPHGTGIFKRRNNKQNKSTRTKTKQGCSN